MDLLSFLFTTSSFCVIFLVKVYTVFFRKKVGGSERSWLLGGS